MKVAVFLANGFEEIEGLTVVDLLRRAGIETQMVSITGSQRVTGSHKIEVTADFLLENADFGSFDMLVLPGGMPGTLNLEACKPLMEQLDAFYQADKWIGAICAAPTVFGHRGYLKDRKAGCYPGMEDGLLGAKVSFDSVNVDGHVITSRGMGTAIDFGLAIIEQLISKEAAEEMAKKIVYA